MSRRDTYEAKLAQLRSKLRSVQKSRHALAKIMDKWSEAAAKATKIWQKANPEGLEKPDLHWPDLKKLFEWLLAERTAVRCTYPVCRRAVDGALLRAQLDQAREGVADLSADIHAADVLLDAALGQEPGTMSMEVLAERLPTLIKQRDAHAARVTELEGALCRTVVIASQAGTWDPSDVESGRRLRTALDKLGADLRVLLDAAAPTKAPPPAQLAEGARAEICATCEFWCAGNPGHCGDSGSENEADQIAYPTGTCEGWSSKSGGREEHVAVEIAADSSPALMGIGETSGDEMNCAPVDGLPAREGHPTARPPAAIATKIPSKADIAFARQAFDDLQKRWTDYGVGDRPMAGPVWMLWLSDLLDQIVTHKRWPTSASAKD